MSVVNIRPPADVPGMVFDMEDCLIRAKYYSEAIGVVLEYAGPQIDESVPPAVKTVLQLLKTDLEKSVIEARKRWDELRRATARDAG